MISMDAIEEIIDDALPRASHQASWWETERSPDEQHAAARGSGITAGFIAIRLPDGSGVKISPEDGQVYAEVELVRAIVAPSDF